MSEIATIKEVLANRYTLPFFKAHLVRCRREANLELYIAVQGFKSCGDDERNECAREICENIFDSAEAVEQLTLDNACVADVAALRRALAKAEKRGEYVAKSVFDGLERHVLSILGQEAAQYNEEAQFKKSQEELRRRHEDSTPKKELRKPPAKRSKATSPLAQAPASPQKSAPSNTSSPSKKSVVSPKSAKKKDAAASPETLPRPGSVRNLIAYFGQLGAKEKKEEKAKEKEREKLSKIRAKELQKAAAAESPAVKRVKKGRRMSWSPMARRKVKESAPEGNPIVSLPQKPKLAREPSVAGDEKDAQEMEEIDEKVSRLLPADSDKYESEEIKSIISFSQMFLKHVYKATTTAEKMSKRMERDIEWGQQVATALMEFTKQVHRYDGSSLLADASMTCAETVATVEELRASLSRNSTRKLIDPLKGVIRTQVTTSLMATEAATQSEEAAIEVFRGGRKKGIALACDSVLHFMEVYNSYFRVNYQHHRKCIDKLTNFRSIIELQEHRILDLQEGEVVDIPMRDIILQMAAEISLNGEDRSSRWVVLLPRRIVLYKDSKIEGAAISGVIPLDDVVVDGVSAGDADSGGELRIDVTQPSRNGRVVHSIFVGDATIHREWLDMIRSCVDHVHLGSFALVEAEAARGSTPSSVHEFLTSNQLGTYWRDFHSKTEWMLTWISKPETISELLPYLLMEHDLDDDDAAEGSGAGDREQRKIYFAFLASTALRYDKAVVMSLVMFGHLLDRFFAFLDQPPPLPAAASVYFFEVWDYVIGTITPAIFRYLDSHEAVLDRLLVHLASQNVLQRLIKLPKFQNSDAQTRVCNYIGEGAVALFLELSPSLNDDRFSHVAIAIAQLLRHPGVLIERKGARPASMSISAVDLNTLRTHDRDALATKASSAPSVESSSPFKSNRVMAGRQIANLRVNADPVARSPRPQRMSRRTRGGPAAVSASIVDVSSVNTDIATAAESSGMFRKLCNQAPQLVEKALGSCRSALGIGNVGATPCSSTCALYSLRVVDAVVSAMGDRHAAAYKGFNPVAEELLKRTSDVLAILEHGLPSRSKSASNGAIPPLGTVRIELVRLLSTLVQVIPTSYLERPITRGGLLDALVRLVFTYRNNSILHSTATEVIAGVFEFHPRAGMYLMRKKKVGFAEKVSKMLEKGCGESQGDADSIHAFLIPWSTLISKYVEKVEDEGLASEVASWREVHERVVPAVLALQERCDTTGGEKDEDGEGSRGFDEANWTKHFDQFNYIVSA